MMGGGTTTTGDMDAAAAELGFQRACDFRDEDGNVYHVLVLWSPWGTYVANAVSYAGRADRGTLKLTFMHPGGGQEHGAEFECGLDGWERDETEERDPKALEPGRTLADMLRDASIACAAHQQDLASRPAWAGSAPV